MIKFINSFIKFETFNMTHLSNKTKKMDIDDVYIFKHHNTYNLDDECIT